jgi:hypothetical protein
VNKSAAAAQRSLVPPEEQFWHRYSPHHEFPLSSITSFVLHALIIGLLLLIGAVIVWTGQDKQNDPVRLGSVRFEGGGGGGSPEGTSEDGPGAARASKSEDVQPSKPGGAAPEVRSDTSSANLQDPSRSPGRLEVPEVKDGAQARQSTEINFGEIGEKARRAQEDIKRQLTKGRGGSGSGGGKDTGKDKGRGSRVGSGKDLAEKRDERQKRWKLNFTTRNPQDYVRQMEFFKATIVIPTAGGGYAVAVDRGTQLRPPRVQDISTIEGVFWVDDKPESVKRMCAGLGIHEALPWFAAFFPEDFERDLLRKELEFRGKREEQINETRFNVVSSGGGYQVVVASQQ